MTKSQVKIKKLELALQDCANQGQVKIFQLEDKLDNLSKQNKTLEIELKKAKRIIEELKQ